MAMTYSDIDIATLIKTIRESFVGADQVYNDGSCMRFSLILQEIFPTAVPVMTPDKKHCLTRIGNEVWDINGLYTGPTIYFERGEWEAVLDDGFSIYESYFMEPETRAAAPKAEGKAAERIATWNAYHKFKQDLEEQKA